jgi:hypothetical protein
MFLTLFYCDGILGCYNGFPRGQPLAHGASGGWRLLWLAGRARPPDAASCLHGWGGQVNFGDGDLHAQRRSHAHWSGAVFLCVTSDEVLPASEPTGPLHAGKTVVLNMRVLKDEERNSRARRCAWPRRRQPQAQRERASRQGPAWGGRAPTTTTSGAGLAQLLASFGAARPCRSWRHWECGVPGARDGRQRRWSRRVTSSRPRTPKGWLLPC